MRPGSAQSHPIPTARSEYPVYSALQRYSLTQCNTVVIIPAVYLRSYLILELSCFSVLLGFLICLKLTFFAHEVAVQLTIVPYPLGGLSLECLIICNDVVESTWYLRCCTGVFVDHPSSAESLGNRRASPSDCGMGPSRAWLQSIPHCKDHLYNFR